MKRAKLVLKLAAFLATALITAIYLGQMMNESHTGRTQLDYHALFTDVSYLRANQEVRIGGVRIGTVTNLQMQADGLVRVDFVVADPPHFPATLSAAVRYKNVVGDRYLELTPGEGGGVFAPGSTIPASRTKPAVDLDILVGALRPLFRTLEPDQINNITEAVLASLQGQSGAVAVLLGSLASVTSTLADRDQVIGTVITTLRDTLTVLADRQPTLNGLVENLQALISGLADGKDPVTAAVVHVNALTSTAASLLGQVRPDLKDDITRIEAAAGGLNKNTAAIEQTVKDLPEAYRAISRIGVYGDFFNFFICNLRIRMSGLHHNEIYTRWFDSAMPRCDGEPLK